jgi:hypothetical protein
VVSCHVYHSAGSVIKSSLVTGSNAFVAGSNFISSHTTAISGVVTTTCIIQPEFCLLAGGGALTVEATANDVLAIRYPNSVPACLAATGEDIFEEGISVLPSLSGEIETSDGTIEPALPKNVRRFVNGIGGGVGTGLSVLVDKFHTGGACGCGS